MYLNIRFAAAHALTPVHAMDILIWLMERITNNVPSPLTILAITGAAFTKKGTVTDEWIARYLDGINAVFNQHASEKSQQRCGIKWLQE